MCWRRRGAVQRALEGGERHAPPAHLLHRSLAEGVRETTSSNQVTNRISFIGHVYSVYTVTGMSLHEGTAVIL